jgi:predicted nucleic acid-binding protein
MTIRVVLDTSALIDVERHELAFAAHAGYFTMLWSAFIIGEFVRVRTELALEHGQSRDVYRDRIHAAIRELSLIAEFVDYTLLQSGDYSRWLKDPDDEPILATALVRRAQYVVSHNTKHFPPSHRYADVQYLIPRAFLDWLYSQLPDGKPLADWQASDYRLP